MYTHANIHINLLLWMFHIVLFFVITEEPAIKQSINFSGFI